MKEEGGRKRGRPRDPAILQNIVEMGGQAMIELGFERASMEQIAARAGVSKMTLYNYFPNKLALLEHCVRHKTDLYFEGFDEARYDPLKPERSLRLLATQFLSLVRDPEVIRMIGMMHGMARIEPEVCQSYFVSGPAVVMQRIHAYLEKAHACKSLKIKNVALSSMIFLGMLMAHSHVIGVLGLGTTTAAEDEKLVDEAVAMFMGRYEA